MKIAIVTDAWKPQVNGVVQTLGMTRAELVRSGHDVLLVTPEGRRTLPCPGYPEIALSLLAGASVRRELGAFDPDAIHIATEGPLGLAARRYALSRRLPFTTAYHTQFPEYLRARLPVPIALTARVLRRFHAPAARTLVPTEAIRAKLLRRGHANVVVWSRGVDAVLFNPDRPHAYSLPRPIWIYLGRVAVEKNIEAFLTLELPGSKVVIGDGPDRARIQSTYGEAHFYGYRFGEELARLLAGGDVFVFPSRTDTYGLVMLEAMACGLPVAAFPVDGAIDVVQHGRTGILDHDLGVACRGALELDRARCRAFAAGQSWQRATREFESYLEPRTRDTASAQPLSSVSR